MKTFEEINKVISDIKSKGGDIHSNFYYNLTDPSVLYDTYVGENSVVFVQPYVTRNNVIYYTSDLEECSGLLKELPLDSVVSIVKNDDADNFGFLNQAGYNLYSVQQKIGEKLLPLDEQKEKMSHYKFDRFYDDKFGQYAEEDDIDEIQSIILEAFDKYDDDFFSDEEMLRMIKKEEVLIDKVEGEIKTLHIYHVQGKKFFSNLIYNTGWAGALYTLEKKALLNAIEKYGVTYRYGWIRLSNTSAWRRNTMLKEEVFNLTYRKEL